MVEINNQRKAFLDMLVVEGIDNGQKTRNHGYDVIVGGELFTDVRSPSNRHAKPKLKINRRRTLPASFLLVGCLPQAAWPERLLSEKSDAVALQQIKERGALPMIDRGDIRQAIDRCNIWASLPGAGYGRLSIRLTAWLQKFKEAAERSERLMYEQSHRDYSACYLHHRSPVMGC